MTVRTASFRNRRYNSYVPAAAYAADVIHEGPYQVDFGTPTAANAIAILSAQSIATAGVSQGLAGNFPLLVDMIADQFGRNLSVVASGAATSNVTVRGRDYLGQPMVESFTLNGTTPVVGVKAFKWIDSVTYAATAATTVNVGIGGKLGVPYRMSRVIGFEEANGASVAAGTLASGDTTDPQTATTPDPRGLYTPTTTMNGTNRIRSILAPYNLLNANGNGGLYGLPHFYA